MKLTENQIEQFTLGLFASLGYQYIQGTDLAPNREHQERENYSDVVLFNRLQQSVNRLNPDIPYNSQQEAIREVLNIASSDLISNNQKFHQYLTEGITVEFQQDGETRGRLVWLMDWENPENNEFIAVNQFTIMEDNHKRRLDIILFVNGLPLVVIELKNPAAKKADIYAAFNQLQTYKKQIPSLFTYNSLLVISDGLTAKAGSLSAEYDRFMEWKTPSPSPSPWEGLGEGGDKDKKRKKKERDRSGEVLFIDASELGYMVNRRNRAFADEDIAKIVDTYHGWKKTGGHYQDIKGFCKSATLEEIQKHKFVLTPGRYVGIPDEVDDGVSFEEKMGALTTDLAAQMEEGLALDEEIKTQLAKVGFEI